MQYPSLPSIVKKFGLLPSVSHSKKYGQNFIFDETIIKRIVTFSRIKENDIVLEIGPGPGGLTRQILATKPTHCVSIEYDKLCINALQYLKDSNSNFTVLYEDALNVKVSNILKDVLNENESSKLKIVANLPYNIATELLTRWFLELQKIESMTLMFQKEVADRIASKPSTKEYGRLSIISQLLCDIEHGFDLAPEAFTPSPKVISSVIHFTPKPDFALTLQYIEKISKLTNYAFQQRRKKIKTSLKNAITDLDNVLKELNIDENLRAENLLPNDFLKLAMHI